MWASGSSITFVVDPGTEMTTMPAGVAKVRNLPIPRRPISGFNFQGQEVRSGLLRARIPGMDATEYVFPCYFLGDPNMPPAHSRNLLGLTGVINQIRLTFDGIYLADRAGLGSSWSRRGNRNRETCRGRDLFGQRPPRPWTRRAGYGESKIFIGCVKRNIPYTITSTSAWRDRLRGPGPCPPVASSSAPPPATWAATGDWPATHSANAAARSTIRRSSI